MDLNDLEAVMQLLDDKLIRTDSGAYIRVEDLRELQAQYRDMKRAEEEAPKIKTMAAAKIAAMKDEEFVKSFRPQNPSIDIPPVGVHVKPEEEETKDAA